jgi:hypothetical protein
MAYVREILTYCFLAPLQCLGRDVGAINGFCSNVIICFFQEDEEIVFWFRSLLVCSMWMVSRSVNAGEQYW